MRRTLALVAVVGLCLTLMVGVGAASHEDPDRAVLAFELQEGGDARMFHITSFDLNESEGRERYEAFANNETKQAELRESVLEELRSQAENASEATGREMRIHNVSVVTYEKENYGRVEVRGDWDNLAYSDGRQVVVTEPFRSSYEPDGRIAIHGPEGYQRTRTDPSPIRAQANSALWNPRTVNFTGFYAEFTNPDAETTTAATATATPSDSRFEGFGTFLRALLIALVPVALVLLAVRRQ
ncbi:MAG: hypothetical protein ACI8UR_001512 [Natronomonas sp.]|jgi:hypothetical protein|uniref:DUF7345 domain-containing protein n=1 Tax=Natronomonas sp. TaxID=2184060 RepID=UPI0039893739